MDCENEAADRAYRVADVVARFVRLKKFVPEKTYGHVFGEKVTELAGDSVALDTTEEVLIALKRGKVITGRRMVSLLGRHHRETRG